MNRMTEIVKYPGSKEQKQRLWTSEFLIKRAFSLGEFTHSFFIIMYNFIRVKLHWPNYIGFHFNSSFFQRRNPST